MEHEKELGFNSLLIHGGMSADPLGSATVPIYQTSTFAFANVDEGARCFAGESDGYIYTRIGNPTIAALEKQIAILEKGFGAIATSSGMAAVSTIYMAFLKSGDHIVSTDAVYGPARGIMESYFRKFGVESTYLNTSDLDAVRRAIRPNTRMLYIETPTNPTMEISDLEACCAIAHEHGLVAVVDNTFSSPYLQRPIELGADVVFHSMTKFINGHADIVAGIIIAKTEELYLTIRPAMVGMGCNMDPHQAYMVLRGVKTLAIRVARAQENAIQVADYLERHPKVAWVKYPGLKSHPQYALAQKQMDGPGAMISFELKGGLGAGKVLMDNVRLAMLAVSLGGIETLIQHPASMTHSKMSRENREKAGISDGLVRFAVGIEDLQDIIADLDQALARI
ncbi:MAG: aminotransferase class I/II-fold pyridoxal phosphate-dependent enzyme [Acidobacteria bacterium]|jgi:methionine-gamma-lyase|nr:aminotransferase class I/II-fold pyridoxal phosphate-dependent enzyme [Acidobacteriota bacterium]